MCYLVWKIPFWNLVVGAFGLIVTGIWGRIEMCRRQYRRFWPDTHWNNKEEQGSEKSWVLDWVLTEVYMLPGLKDNFWKMAKGIILYVGGKNLGRFQRDGGVK